MKITKQLNNNAIVTSDAEGREVVLMGKGLGFQCRLGAEPDMSRVEKQFFALGSGTHADRLAELLVHIPLEHLDIGIRITDHVRQKLQKPLQETLALLLADRIALAIERHGKELEPNDALLTGIQQLFPEEYRLGLDALGIIEEAAGVRLRPDEAGYLALCFVNAQYEDGELPCGSAGP